MLEVGDTVQIHGKEGVVCFEKLEAGERYVCVAFGEKPITYEIYKYKYENDKLLVKKIDDSDELGSIIGEFTKESVRDYGMLESLKPVSQALDKYYQEHKEELESN